MPQIKKEAEYLTEVQSDEDSPRFAPIDEEVVNATDLHESIVKRETC